MMESNIDSNTQLNTPHPIPPSPVTVKGTGSLVSIANSGCVPLESQSQSWRPLSSNVAETRPSSTVLLAAPLSVHTYSQISERGNIGFAMLI